MMDLFFLHIGKNAGTQIMRYFPFLKEKGINAKKVPHDFKLKDIPSTVPYFFSIRNPIDRFVSGFYSRKRKGQPRLHVEWSDHERVAFEQFATANDLAEALYRADELGDDAVKAIMSITHSGMHQIDWFVRCGNLDLRPPLWIVRQENFDSDMVILFRRLGLTLPNLGEYDSFKLAHRTDYRGIEPLSDLAKDNLSRWYDRDIVFCNFVDRWLEQRI